MPSCRLCGDEELELDELCAVCQLCEVCCSCEGGPVVGERLDELVGELIDERLSDMEEDERGYFWEKYRGI